MLARMMFGAALVAVCATAQAQAIVGAPERVAARGHVSYEAENATVVAGKTSVIELRFRVDPGFHVNSHKPASELLIPTAFTASDATVKVLSADYPKGESFHLAAGDGERLDVYQGEFRVRLTVVAPKGETTLAGTLRYQACDTAACYPPRSLPVSVLVVGK